MKSEGESGERFVIYGIRYLQEDTPSGVVQQWFTTRAKAERRLKRLKKADETVFVEKMPATAAGLVEFLNRRAYVG
jgi:hypothetical protein